MIGEVLKKLLRKEGDLTADEASRAMAQIMTGEAGEARTAALLTALALKGETGAEIEAFARSMRHAALRWPGEAPPVLVDTCGTGGDSQGTLNISTLSAILLAGLDIPVAKHGNRAVSSTTGSADLLEGLGMRLNREPKAVAEELDRVGITFLFAQAWHPAMKHAAPVRKSLGFRTVFNLLGPLTNPAPVNYQVVGVFHKDYMERMAHAMSIQGRKGAYLLHSDDGLDEVSPAAPTHYIRIASGKIVDQGQLTPEDFDLKGASLSDLRPVDREDAIRRSRAILEGKGSDAENHTIAMNAALIYGMVHDADLKSAAAACVEGLRAGRGAELLARWVC
ncbi:MAG: anthranilate phosphoribosyltransferase [bacterium]|nr:anthranilate phosphoribosyltransferase [bacterium]